MQSRVSAHIILPDGSKHSAAEWGTLKASVLKPKPAFWNKGNGELSIDFQMENQQSHLLILWKRHGFHLLHWQETLDDPLIALSGYSYLDLVEFEICGELIPTPAALFVTPTAACAAITAFLQSGAPDPALVWVRKCQQQWEGPQASLTAVGVPPDRIEELKNNQRSTKPLSPTAAFFRHMRARDHDAVLADIQAGINLNKRSGSLHAVALACQQEDAKLLAILLEHGANPNGTDADGWPGLHLTKSEVLARQLLDFHANVNSRVPGGTTPLHSMSFKSLPMARLLIARGAEVDARDADGRTPLIWAISSAHAELVELLLQHGADVNARDNYGAPALQWLFRHRQRAGDTEEVLSVLIRHGVDVLARDRCGNDALLSYCYDSPDLKFVKCFLDAGADPLRVDDLGRSALSKAQKNGNTELVELLLRYRNRR